jgi:hypothetical protein
VAHKRRIFRRKSFFQRLSLAEFGPARTSIFCNFCKPAGGRFVNRLAQQPYLFAAGHDTNFRVIFFVSAEQPGCADKAA